MNTSTPERQAAAVERAAVNFLAHVERLKELVVSKNPRTQRPMHELQMFQEWVPDLVEAAKTLRRAADKQKQVAEAPPIAPPAAPLAVDQPVLDL